MRGVVATLAALCALTTDAWAVPQVGRAFPTFSVRDLNGGTHSQRNFTGRWTVVFAMSDKDTGPALTAWCLRVQRAIPEVARITLVAVDLFPLIPTATVFSQARDNTPRERWGEVWLSRDGELAESLGLPESEVPWVFVVDPSGRVVEAVHGALDDSGLARVLAALPPTAGRTLATTR